MKPPDLMFLEVLLVAVGMIAFGLALPGVGFLLWVGIVLTVGITAGWLINRTHRHGSQY